ncbi:phage tail protein [Photorhabdus sp. SF281]|uniref:phage tail protein n=1 Tax=Photorhabdus sp. SF281 TaxID=3459527 RepID=UPI004044F932
MEIDELLVSVGVDTSQAAKIKDVIVALGAAAVQIANEANGVNKILDGVGEESVKSTEQAAQKAEEAGSSISKLKLLAVGVAAAVSVATTKVLGFINSSITGAKDLAKEKGLLYKISDRELKQSDEYERSMKKMGLSVDSVKTKIALNLVPSMTKAVNGINNWIASNKELITDGLTKIIKVGGKVIQVIVNSVRAINKIVTSTTGWKAAIMLIVGALAVLKRSMIMAFIANPVVWVIAAIAGLLLLLDDLMVYLDGGESLFGAFWGPAIKWVKDVIKWGQDFYAKYKGIIDNLVSIWSQSFKAIWTIFSGVFQYIWNVIKLFVGLFTGDMDLVSEAWAGMTASLMKIWNGLIAYLKAFFAFFGAMWDIAGKLAGNAWNVMKKLAGKAFDWIKGKAKGFVSSIGSIFRKVWGHITAPFKKAFKFVLGLFGVSEKDADKYIDNIGKAFDAVFGFITQPFKNAFKLVKSLIDIATNDNLTFTEKIEEIFGAVWGFITSPFKKAFKFVLGLFGVNESEADKYVSNIGKTFDNVIEAIKAPFKAAFDWVVEYYDKTVGKVIGAIKDFFIGNTKSEEATFGFSDDDLKNIQSSVVAGSGDFIGGAIANTTNTTNSSQTMTSHGDVNMNVSITSPSPEKAAQYSANEFNKALKIAGYNTKGQFYNGAGG